ncbi:MAG: envelope stress response membrane protein PspB [Rhodospirillaceae bacterium]|jgi:phage shock protein B
MSSLAIFPVAIAFVVIVLPIWIIAHYGTKWRSNKVITEGDERLLSELWDTAGKMEERVRTLERILDEEAPDWRTRV